MPHSLLKQLWVENPQARLGHDRIWEREWVGTWEGGSYKKNCNKEIEPIIVDLAPTEISGTHSFLFLST